MAKSSDSDKNYGSGMCCPHCALGKYPCANMERTGKSKESKGTTKDKD
ncbi:MAG: hypothetical protein JW738_03720 [Actinobacteria bacterium]|nr:hypothetical protein [Actinomycetota bacterium]